MATCLDRSVAGERPREGLLLRRIGTTDLGQGRGRWDAARKVNTARGCRVMQRSGVAMKTCLVVDDSSVIRKVARRILEGMQFEISEAEDGPRPSTCAGRSF